MQTHMINMMKRQKREIINYGPLLKGCIKLKS